MSTKFNLVKTMNGQDPNYMLDFWESFSVPDNRKFSYLNMLGRLPDSSDMNNIPSSTSNKVNNSVVILPTNMN